MAASKVIVYFLAVLIPLTFIHCQDIPSFPSIPGIPSFPGIPNFPRLPHIRGQRQAPSSDDDGDHAHQDRFFFSFFQGTPTSCNYTTEAGCTCRSCTQALNCQQGDTGTIRTCHGLLPYCNSGVCSPFSGPACVASITTTTTTTTTTAATGK